MLCFALQLLSCVTKCVSVRGSEPLLALASRGAAALPRLLPGHRPGPGSAARAVSSAAPQLRERRSGGVRFIFAPPPIHGLNAILCAKCCCVNFVGSSVVKFPLSLRGSEPEPEPLPCRSWDLAGSTRASSSVLEQEQRGRSGRTGSCAAGVRSLSSAARSRRLIPLCCWVCVAAARAWNQQTHLVSEVSWGHCAAPHVGTNHRLLHKSRYSGFITCSDPEL